MYTMRSHDLVTALRNNTLNDRCWGYQTNSRRRAEGGWLCRVHASRKAPRSTAPETDLSGDATGLEAEARGELNAAGVAYGGGLAEGGGGCC